MKILLVVLILMTCCCAPSPKGGKNRQGFKTGEWVKFKKDGRRGFVMAGPQCLDGAAECEYKVWLDDYTDPVWLNEGTLQEDDR